MKQLNSPIHIFEMEFDQCIMDGNPCEQGSMYCSEECKQLDVMEHQNVFFDGDDGLESLVASPLELPVEYGSSPDYLLYECAFCNFTHTASTPCLHFSNNYTTEPDYLTLERHDSFSAPTQKSIPSGATILETLQDYTVKTTDDTSVIRNNQLIQSNYQKWLAMGNQ